MENLNGKNRRRAVRVQFPYAIHIHTVKGAPISTYTEDISAGGVRVVTQEKLELNCTVDLKIYVGDRFVRCRGKIIWVKEKTSSVLDGVLFYSAGIEFAILSRDDRALLDKCIKDLESRQKRK